MAIPEMIRIKSDINKRSSDTIISMVSEEFGVSIEQIMSSRRDRKYVEPRQIAMYLIRKYVRMAFKDISMMFGGRDHTTAIHSINTVKDHMKTEPQYNDRVINLELKLTEQ